MRGPFLVLLLLVAAALGSHAQVVETKHKDGKHHYKRDVRQDYSYKTAEEHHPQHGTGPGPKQHSYGGPQKDSYEGQYKQQECHDDCPNPQPPESVTNGGLLGAKSRVPANQGLDTACPNSWVCGKLMLSREHMLLSLADAHSPTELARL